LNETKAAIAMFSSRPAIEPYVGHAEALREQWADLHPSRQKAIIAALLDRVYVKRAERRGAPFNSERLRALWRV
jgi:hypothetical protein